MASGVGGACLAQTCYPRRPRLYCRNPGVIIREDGGDQLVRGENCAAVPEVVGWTLGLAQEGLHAPGSRPACRRAIEA